jgi:hypothetical protein
MFNEAGARRGDPAATVCPGEEETVRRTGGRMIVVVVVALVLAVPATAQAPADGWQGWTWSGVVERLAGWAGGVLGVFGASETGTLDETDGGDGDTAAVPTDSTTTTDSESDDQSDSYPHIDPDG